MNGPGPQESGAPSDAQTAGDLAEAGGVRRLLFLVGAFLAGTLVVGMLVLGALYLYFEHPWDRADRDPRALPGSGDMPLRDALKYTGTELPKEAADVRFSAGGNMMGTSLSLFYKMPCGAVPAMTQAAGLTVPVTVNGLENRAREFAKRTGWRPEDGPTAALNDTRYWTTAAMVQTLPAGVCAVWLEAFND
jgi:hypothetical protein